MTQGQFPSPDAVNRIRRSVKWTEAQQLDLAGGGASPTTRATTFWALITGKNLDGTRYSWCRAVPIEPEGTIGETRFATDTRVSGTDNLFEVNGRFAANGSIVRITLVTYDETGVPQYAFEAVGAEDPWKPVPIHDHRSNEAGGFAFSVYHPGTALPQQRWAI